MFLKHCTNHLAALRVGREQILCTATWEVPWNCMVMNIVPKTADQSVNLTVGSGLKLKAHHV